MSGLALVCAELGATVSGSDRADSSYMERLRAAGLEPASATTPPTCPRAPRSSSRPRSATTTRSWRWPASAGIEPIHRGELLAELCAEKRLIAVAGTHGKTTTTAMLVWALRGARRRPRLLRRRRGARAGRGRRAANAGWGEGEWVVAEADESDASFLELRPEIAVVTNVEMDHHSRWGSVAELRAAFRSSPRGEGVAPAGGEPRRASRRGPRRVRRPSARAGRAAARRARSPQPCSTPAPRWRRSTLAGVDLDAAAAALAGFPGRPAPARAQGRARRHPHIRRLRPPPDRGPRRPLGPARAAARGA